MAERRRFSISAGMLESPGVERVVEHDMDMKRAKPQESAVTSRLGDLMRWLVPSGRPTGSPMRSVAREIEELWPSRDR
ncbi:MAG TPA: hypothetical protein VL393_05865 [Candidatus Binataceae bacterium]|nr:hypothetical protein [Candidatus Binataceae bacterium]